MCALKKDDISIGWSSWSVVGPIILSNLWFDYGISSNQIRTNDVRNVVLLVVDSSSIHHYIFWSDQCYHRVHLIVEFHLYGSLDGLLMSPSTTSLSPPWFGWTSKLALETFESIFLVLAHEVYVLMEEVTSSSSRAYDASCRRELEKVCFASSGIIPSQSCIRAKYSLVWRLATFNLYESLAQQATDWFVQEKEVLKC